MSNIANPTVSLSLSLAAKHNFEPQRIEGSVLGTAAPGRGVRFQKSHLMKKGESSGA